MILDSPLVNTICPSCHRATALHRESVAIGVEVLCQECGALLAVEQREPLRLVEIEPEDL